MGKNLSAYLNALGPLVRKSVIHEPEQVIRGVANDSRRVGKDFIFCAIKGAKSDGHCFISDAVRNGASVIFASDEVTVPEWISVIYVSDSYHAWGVLCAEFFDNPADHLDIFAVTGTNGKTSIAFMLKRILMAHGLACGLISTVEYDDGGQSSAGRSRADNTGLLQHSGAFRANASERLPLCRDRGVQSRASPAPDRQCPVRPARSSPI